MIVNQKICSGCKVEKVAGCFTSHKYTTSGGNLSVRLDSRCKDCRRIAAKNRRKNIDVREREAESCRLRRAKNPESVASYAKAYRESEGGKRTRAKLQRIRKARLRAGSVLLSVDDDAEIKRIYASAVIEEKKLRACVTCDDDLELQVHVDHVVPISLGGLHHPDNLQLLSGRKNILKGATFCLAQ